MPRTVTEARATLLLAVPIILGQVSQMLMNALDSLMIGQVGKVPLAASAFAGSVFGFCYLGAFGLCVPVSVMVSRAHGEERPGECGAWLRHGAAVALCAGLLVMAAMEVLGRNLDLLGQPAEVVEAAQPFFSLIAVSLVPALVFQAFRQFSESLGHPWIPMAIMLAGVALNVVLNWILIYGNLGMPALGLAGAGIATLTARCTDLLVLWLFLKRHAGLRQNWPLRWRARLEWARIRELLNIGIPASGQLVFEAGAFTVAAWMMGRIGTEALAAHQIALSCAGLTFMFPLGISMAAGMRVSQALGAGRLEAIRPIGHGALGMSCLVMGSFGLLLWLGGPSIARCFVDDPGVVALAGRLLAIAALFQLFDGGQVVGAGLLRGLSDMKVPTVITFAGYWCVMLPAAYWLGVAAGNPLGVWRALASGLAIVAILLVLRFRWRTQPARLGLRRPVCV